MDANLTESVVYERLTTVFRDVLDDDSIRLSDATTAKDIMDWDSLNHVRLIAAMEKEFRVKFDIDDLAQFAKVGHFVDAILKKSGA